MVNTPHTLGISSLYHPTTSRHTLFYLNSPLTTLTHSYCPTNRKQQQQQQKKKKKKKKTTTTKQNKKQQKTNKQKKKKKKTKQKKTKKQKKTQLLSKLGQMTHGRNDLVRNDTGPKWLSADHTLWAWSVFGFTIYINFYKT